MLKHITVWFGRWLSSPGNLRNLIKKLTAREFGRYILAGISTTLLNLVLYSILLLCGLKYYWANLIAIISAKLYAYAANKFFVFKSRRLNTRENIAEAGAYFAARGATGVFDYAAVIILVEYLGLSPFYSKYAIMGAVIVLNYILGKYYVFKPRTAKAKKKK